MMQELATEYIRQGHVVSLVTPSEAVDGNLEIIKESGVTVVRVKTGDMKYAKKAVRMWRESRLSSTIWRKAHKYLKENPCDLIIYYSPTIFFGELVKRLKTLWGCTSYLILRDIFPKWALDVGVLREGVFYRYLKRKELEQYAAADWIGIESLGNMPYMDAELPGHQGRIEVLYNWLDTWKKPDARNFWRRELRLEGKAVFFYGGNIGVAQDMDNIIRLAAGLRDHEEIFFLLVGGGSETERMNGEIERQHLKNIRIHPPITQNDYMECLSEFDVGLISIDRNMQSHNLTGKLLGYVLCGKPILASLNPENGLIEILKGADAGIAIVNGEDEKLRAAALLLSSQPDTRLRMGVNARALGESMFSVQAIAKQLISHFDPVDHVAVDTQYTARNCVGSELENQS
jgi:glycosyltransferase involved in cell wall biosynthesis